MNKRTKKTNRGKYSRKNKRTGKLLWKGGHTSAQFNVILNADEKKLVSDISANFNGTSTYATNLGLTNGDKIVGYVTNLQSDLSSNEMMHGALGLYQELIFVGEQLDDKEKPMDFFKLEKDIKAKTEELKNATAVFDTKTRDYSNALFDFNNLQTDINNKTNYANVGIANYKKKLREFLVFIKSISIDNKEKNGVVDKINDINKNIRLSNWNPDVKTKEYEDLKDLIDALNVEIGIKSTTNNPIADITIADIDPVINALNNANALITDLQTKNINLNQLKKNVADAETEKNVAESIKNALETEKTALETQKTDLDTALNNISEARKVLKQNLLGLIELIRKLNYLYSPSWVDTIEHKINSELLTSILRGNILAVINKLTKPKPQSKSKGVNIRFDTYDSALNDKTGKPLKKKTVMSMNSYGNNPVENAEETLVGLFNNPQTSLTQAIKPPAPTSTTNQSFNISQLNP